MPFGKVIDLTNETTKELKT